MTREWYMHPNGQLPLTNWHSGVNPPVHAWAAASIRVGQESARVSVTAIFSSAFSRNCLNFTWWVNRKDADGEIFFRAAFSVSTTSASSTAAPLPTGGYIEQSGRYQLDGMYCLNMLAIALDLAWENSAYEDVASKFFEHFVYIARR